MKRSELYHPRVFDTPEWSEKYYKHNYKHIVKTGKDIVKQLKAAQFTSGKILDAGCGFGAVTIEIAKAFPQSEIIAIDLAAPLLEKAQKDAEKQGVINQITFQKGDVQQLEFGSNTFDLVINTFIMHIVENPVAMLNEFERVAKPDGKILIMDLCRIWLALFIKELKKAMTIKEAMEIIQTSQLRTGQAVQGPFWWAYRIGFKIR